MINYFNDNRLIRDFTKSLALIKIEKDEPLSSEIKNAVKTAFNGISSFDREYSSICKITYEKQYELIKTYIENILEADKDDIATNNAYVTKILTSLYKIIYERVIRKMEWYTEHESPILILLMKDNGVLSAFEYLRIDVWRAEIQQSVINERAEKHKSDVEGIVSQFKDSSNKSLDQIIDYYNIIKSFEEKLDGHRKYVQELSSEYNFVRIADAFKRLVAEKKSDLTTINRNMKFVATAVILPLIISFFSSLLVWHYSPDAINTLKEKIILGIPIIVPLEAVLIYFFRIILKEQLSLKAQILQLELRYSVCAFIEGYADFTKEIPREKLEKFEALIFSGITPDPSAIPGTFDGMDQLINLARAAGGSK